MKNVLPFFAIAIAAISVTGCFSSADDATPENFTKYINQRLATDTRTCFGQIENLSAEFSDNDAVRFEALGLMKTVSTRVENGFFKKTFHKMALTPAGQAAKFQYKTKAGGENTCFKWANVEVASIDAIQDVKEVSGSKMVTFTLKVKDRAPWSSDKKITDKVTFFYPDSTVSDIESRKQVVFTKTTKGWEII